MSAIALLNFRTKFSHISHTLGSYVHKQNWGIQHGPQNLKSFWKIYFMKKMANEWSTWFGNAIRKYILENSSRQTVNINPKRYDRMIIGFLACIWGLWNVWYVRFQQFSDTNHITEPILSLRHDEFSKKGEITGYFGDIYWPRKTKICDFLWDDLINVP